MKKQVFISIFLYLFVFLVLIITVYGLFNEKVEIVIPSLLIMVVSLIFGFMLNSYILKQKFDVDENVLHLTKEILHELAIPLSTIQANALLLKRTLNEDAKSLKRLKRIEDSSKRLERLYEELIYSIKKEIRSVEKEEVALKPLIEERVNIMKMLHRNPFLLELDAETIVVDKIGFEKMFDNILTNAMKYSPKEHTITISLEGTILSIADKGIGMSELELRKIYERYVQLDNARYGEGIGLALVKAYCDDEKISINIYSKKGEGTTVDLNLKKIIV
jgi:signal transduction histidine kinase